MPPKITDADKILISAYAEAALRIEKLLSTASPEQTGLILSRTDAILAELRELTQKYVSKDIPQHFVSGSTDAIERLSKATQITSIDRTFSLLHRESIQNIADDAADSFGNAVLTLRKNVERRLSQVEKQRIVTELITANVSGENTKEAVKEALEKEGISGIQVGNRTLQLDHYASVISYTVLADAYNMGAATRYIANGVEYGRVVERAEAPDKLCQWMKDKIVWLGNRQLLNPYHPNCFGSIVPWFGDTSQALRSIDDPRIPEYVRKALQRKS